LYLAQREDVDIKQDTMFGDIFIKLLNKKNPETLKESNSTDQVLKPTSDSEDYEDNSNSSDKMQEDEDN
jgi:hypothetical protein